MSLPDEVYDAGNAFVADFDIVDDRGRGRVEVMWENRPNVGVTGIWFPHASVMAVADPPLAHHDDLYASVSSNVETRPPILPWKALYIDGGWYVETPGGGGSMWRHSQLEDSDVWNREDQIPPETVWPVVYTSRVLGIPPSATLTIGYSTHNHDADPVVQLDVEMSHAYARLEFTPAGLPRAEVDR